MEDNDGDGNEERLNLLVRRLDHPIRWLRFVLSGAVGLCMGVGSQAFAAGRFAESWYTVPIAVLLLVALAMVGRIRDRMIDVISEVSLALTAEVLVKTMSRQAVDKLIAEVRQATDSDEG